MAVRDIVDDDGTPWKVWAVMSSAIDPKTAAEDFLGDYSEGWLCFECPTGRRRLARFPQDWDRLPDKQLLQLLKNAEAVPPRKHTPPTTRRIRPSRSSYPVTGDVAGDGNLPRKL